ncbi:MAG: ABC transporter ATP-binding protein [Solirubrobacterales bacterium]
MSESIIKLEGVTKRFGKLTAVDDVTVDVPAGRCFAWLGPNGCGKTTLIRMMLGLARATDGNIEVCGHNVPRATATALEQVGGIVEEPRFYPYLSGRANLEVWAAHYGHDSRSRIDSALERVRMLDRADDTVKTYSLGMRQRLGVARALLNDPRLLILDEPTNGLDPAGLAEFRELIRSFVDEGRSVFISSHILGEVQKMADDVAIIQKGKMIAFGSVEELVKGGAQRVYVRSNERERAAKLIGEIEGVKRAVPDEHGGISAEVVTADDAMLAKVGKTLFDNGLILYSLYPVTESLEERFLELTDTGEEASVE